MMQTTLANAGIPETTFTEIDLGVVRFLIESDDPSITDVLARVFVHQGEYAVTPHGRLPREHRYRIKQLLTAEGRSRFSITSNGEEVRSAVVPNWAIPVMASLMSDQLMEAYAECFDTLHAGAVTIGECGILIPGESYSGKSTTSALFAFSGFRFYTDDVAIFDDDLRLIPHPRAIMLRAGGWDRLIESFPQRAENRLVWGNNEAATWYVNAFEPKDDSNTAEHPKIKLILLPTREPEAPTLTPLPRSEVVPVLVKQSFGMASDPAGSLQKIIALVSGADCYRINMLDPVKSAAALRKLAGGLL